VCERTQNLELVEQVAGHVRQVFVAFGNHDDELRDRGHHVRRALNDGFYLLKPKKANM